MPMLQGCKIEEVVTRFVCDFEDEFDKNLEEGINPDTILELEKSIYDVCRRLGDALMALVFGYLLCTTGLDRLAVRVFMASSDGRFKDEGTRTVNIHFAGGSVYAFEVSYLRRVTRRRRGRRRRHGNRGKAGKGVFPVLELLGVHCVHSRMKATSLFEDRLIRALTASDSHEAGRQLLESYGIEMRIGRLQTFFERAGQDFRRQRTQWLTELTEGPIDPEEFVGKRVVISTDGGRIRLRKNKPGRPRKSGYHGFDAEWREPKIFCIYVIDDEGRRIRSIRSIIDGVVTDGDDDTVGADVLFDQLEGYLRALNIDRAQEVIFTGDGAPWIWNRARPMLERLGVTAENIVEVVDWWHAKQALWKLSEKSTLSQGGRARWRNRVFNALRNGDIDRVIEEINTLSLPDDTSDKVDFFDRNRDRMQYRSFDAQGIPQGSGAVESGVRRVINLRMKSNGKYWYTHNANTMLMWRGYLKTGRLDDLTRWSRRFRARWWTDSDQRRAQTMLKAA